MVIYLIACIAKNRAIGYKNQLLYSIKEDLERFKQLTTGHTILMGRKTFESLPHGALPNRKNIVITHQDIRLEGCEVYNSIEEALAVSDDECIYIIGGESIYQQTIDKADKLFLTLVDDYPENADTYFPEVSSTTWKSVIQEPSQTRRTKEGRKLSFHFIILERKATDDNG